MTKVPTDRPLRILLLGEASNYQRALAEGLRQEGCNVTIASGGSRWQQNERDIDISRRHTGKLGGLGYWLRFNHLIDSRLRDFDIVSLTGIHFADLRPARTGRLFDKLKRNNRHVFQILLGSEPEYVRGCLDGSLGLRYNDWKVGAEDAPYLKVNPHEANNWLTPELVRLNDKIFSETEGTLTALYEYQLVAKRLLPKEKFTYVGIPIDTRHIAFRPFDGANGKIKIFLGRHKDRMLQKGTDRMYEAARRVVDRYPSQAELIVVENVPYADYLNMLALADIVLDQLYSYTPATNALLAMAMGKVVVSGAEPEYYEFIGERDLHPIINAIPDDSALESQIEQLILHPETFSGIGHQSRKFVERHNDTGIVARRSLDFWLSRIAMQQ